jgi:hypothetical protein
MLQSAKPALHCAEHVPPMHFTLWSFCAEHTVPQPPQAGSCQHI